MAQAVLDADVAELPVLAHQRAVVGAHPEFAVAGAQHAVGLVRGQSVLHLEVFKTVNQRERQGRVVRRRFRGAGAGRAGEGKQQRHSRRERQRI